jgi:hypothetical protein
MTNRNPSLTLTTTEVDSIVDALLAKKYVRPERIVQMNMSGYGNATEYVRTRFNYKQQNHVTRRSNTLSKLITAAIGTYKSTSGRVYLVKGVKSYYENYALGHVVAFTKEEAMGKGNIIYGYALGEFRPEYKLDATFIGYGAWKEAQVLNLSLLTAANESIKHAAAQVRTAQAKMNMLVALSDGFTQDLNGD